MSDDVWPVIHAERRAPAADLAGLSPEQWHWSHGHGPVVEGPAGALVPATTGRRAVLDEPTGPGAAAVRSR